MHLCRPANLIVAHSYYAHESRFKFPEYSRYEDPQKLHAGHLPPSIWPLNHSYEALELIPVVAKILLAKVLKTEVDEELMKRYSNFNLDALLENK